MTPPLIEIVLNKKLPTSCPSKKDVKGTQSAFKNPHIKQSPKISRSSKYVVIFLPVKKEWGWLQELELVKRLTRYVELENRYEHKRFGGANFNATQEDIDADQRVTKTVTKTIECLGCRSRSENSQVVWSVKILSRFLRQLDVIVT